MKEAPPPLPVDAVVSLTSDLMASRCLEVECPLAESAAPDLNDAPSTCHSSRSIPPHRLSPRDHSTRRPDCPAN